MQTRKIGTLDVTTIGVGCGNFGLFIDEAQTRAVVHAALEGGVTHFDTADVYGEGLSEEFLGRALGALRKDAVITTKFGGFKAPEGVRPASATWVRQSCDASLARLKTDWLDLYLLHHPDPATPIRETLQALGELQAAGKVREIGCSNFGPEQLDEAAGAALELGISGFRTVQNSYSLLDRTPERTLVPACERLGTSLLPYLPLASGLLTGKYKRDDKRPGVGRLALELRGVRVGDYFPALLTDECFDVVESLENYAHDHGHSLTELALAWLVSKPYVASVIAGATSPEQLRVNIAAALSWVLTDEQQTEIAALTASEVAFTWNAGFPSYARPPTSVNAIAAPDVRKQSH